MAYVGGIEGTSINGGNIVLDLTSLTGGLASSPSENDVVYVFIMMVGDLTLPTGYSPLTSQNASGRYLKSCRKTMGATPDSSVTVNGSSSASDGMAAVAYVLRDVDLTTPEDATPTTDSGTGSPDPPSITTVTDGATVIAFAGKALDDATHTPPTGYTNHFDLSGADTNTSSLSVASKVVATAGAENPDAFGAWGSGAWLAGTIAVRPASAEADFSGAPSAQAAATSGTLAPIVVMSGSPDSQGSESEGALASTIGATGSPTSQSPTTDGAMSSSISVAGAAASEDSTVNVVTIIGDEGSGSSVVWRPGEPMSDSNRVPIKIIETSTPFVRGEPVSDRNPLPAKDLSSLNLPWIPGQVISDRNPLPAKDLSSLNLSWVHGQVVSDRNPLPVKIVSTSSSWKPGEPHSDTNPKPIKIA